MVIENTQVRNIKDVNLAVKGHIEMDVLYYWLCWQAPS